MVNFSSLHDEGRPADALHHFHSIELVNALRMVVPWLILTSHDIVIFSENDSSSRHPSFRYHDERASPSHSIRVETITASIE
jgi:hypothetical protein